MWGNKCISCWIPLVETTLKNSTLAFVKGGHQKGETARHTFNDKNAWYTILSKDDMKKTLFDGCTQEEFDEKVTIVPCKAGDIIIFPGTTPHRSMSNETDLTRWSLDFRYHQSDCEGKKNPLDWFYGVKDSLPLTKKGEPNYKPDFETWGKQNRMVIEEGKI